MHSSVWGRLMIYNWRRIATTTWVSCSRGALSSEVASMLIVDRTLLMILVRDYHVEYSIMSISLVSMREWILNFSGFRDRDLCVARYIETYRKFISSIHLHLLKYMMVWWYAPVVTCNSKQYHQGTVLNDFFWENVSCKSNNRARLSTEQLWCENRLQYSTVYFDSCNLS